MLAIGNRGATQHMTPGGSRAAASTPSSQAPCPDRVFKAAIPACNATQKHRAEGPSSALAAPVWHLRVAVAIVLPPLLVTHVSVLGPACTAAGNRGGNPHARRRRHRRRRPGAGQVFQVCTGSLVRPPLSLRLQAEGRGGAERGESS